MTDLELKIKKQIVDFCRTLPLFVDDWKLISEQCKKPMQHLLNLSEQLRHVEKAKLEYMHGFPNTQNILEHQILSIVEEEIVQIKTLLEKLNKITHSFKNKLSTLEGNTLDLDWEEKNELITGNGSQPSLERLLGNSLIFSQYFSEALKNINESYKLINIRDEKSLHQLEKCFSINLSNEKISYLLAITQYVGNEKTIN